MTQDEEMWLRELAAERCVIPQVTARLGPMSLWSKDGLEAEIRRAVEAEREACADLCEQYGFNNHCGTTTDVIATEIRARNKHED
jgi:bacterioferritin-associated ferredoxin